MRESIGSTFLYNIIFVFIIIVMGLLTATLNYYKGYKVNSYILRSLEKYSGYNDSSVEDIDRILKGIGYSAENGRCPSRKNTVLLSDEDQSYCLYYFEDDTSTLDNSVNGDNKPKYYSYGVTTFISIELPIVGKFRVPVYSKGERIFRFTGSCQRNYDSNCM